MTRKNPERRQELMTAAQQLFFTKGYENTSINDIIQAIGVSKGAFYHHFDSKTAVLEAIVSQMADQAIDNLQTIIADETLAAIPKWQKVVQLSNDWKIERKAALIKANRLMMDENILLRHKIRTKTIKVIAVEMSKIIRQGVEEGVFNVEHTWDTAVILMAVIDSLNETMKELLLNLDQYDEPASIALQRNAAMQTAVERLLGAPTGSMPIIDDETLIAWFDTP
ncbi:MAG: TetR/AcrR family transcriptional regulator [Chloroflexi bacterium]|nr:TetR/AcrR family transcriptional regulator [Chloroflexota bacterium]